MPGGMEDYAPATVLSLSDVVAMTGMGGDLLRAWERRYGFPNPLRDRQGRRVYPVTQVDRLQLLCQLVNAGHRPSRIAALPQPQLKALIQTSPLAVTAGSPLVGYSDIVEQLVEALARNDLDALAQGLRRDLAYRGARSFILETAAPLTTAVGFAWQVGRISVHQEHAFSQILQHVLRTVVLNAGSAAGPKFILTTTPGEAHGLGIAMAEAMIALEGGCCLSLGLQTPLEEIAAATVAHQVDVVGLSFSAFHAPRRAARTIETLRNLLAPTVRLWVGGGCVGLGHITGAGVERFASLATIGEAVGGLQTRRAA